MIAVSWYCWKSKRPEFFHVMWMVRYCWQCHKKFIKIERNSLLPWFRKEIKSTFHYSEMAGQNIPVVMRILPVGILFFFCGGNDVDLGKK